MLDDGYAPKRPLIDFDSPPKGWHRHRVREFFKASDTPSIYLGRNREDKNAEKEMEDLQGIKIGHSHWKERKETRKAPFFGGQAGNAFSGAFWRPRFGTRTLPQSIILSKRRSWSETEGLSSTDDPGFLHGGEKSAWAL